MTKNEAARASGLSERDRCQWWRNSIGGRRVELVDQSLESGFEFWHAVRLRLDKREGFAITIDGLFVVPACFVDHAEAIVAIVFVWEVDL